MNNDVYIGKIVNVDGLSIFVTIDQDNCPENVSMKWGIRDYIISIHKYIYAFLPNRKKIIARIRRVYEKDYDDEKMFIKKNHQYIIEARLVSIYDDITQGIDIGINTFPIIGSEIFALGNEIYKLMVEGNSKNKIQIGNSFLSANIPIWADADILFGKHTGIFGNTGTGKSCTIASLIQGLKTRLSADGEVLNNLYTNIVIFDSNNEYEAAFQKTDFRVKKINKGTLRIPHNILSKTEYFKLFDASQGVQAPVLSEAIDRLSDDGSFFDLNGLPKIIGQIVNEKADGNNFSFGQWTNWMSTMVNRIERLLENTDLMNVINTDKNIITSIFKGKYDVYIIDSNYDRSEQDIILYMFCKGVYKKAIEENGFSKQCLMIFEEAHRYINEEESDNYKLGNYYIERLAREGRKYGISLVISSQRPSELSKTILSQCNSFILHKLTNKTDLEFISKSIASEDYELLKTVSGLEQQYAIVFGEAFPYPDIVKICDANPKTDSGDPNVINGWKNQVVE
jgi:uncharacterized protein